MSFTFGVTPAAGTSNLFGGAAQNTTAPKTTFGGFSTPNPQQQQQGQQQQPNGGSLFGSQPAQPANPAPFSFGNTSTSAPTGQTQQAGGGLFGGGQQQQQQQQQQNSLFGGTQAKPTGGLFGSTAQPQQQQQQQQQQGGGMFGGASTNQPAASSTGLFGNSTTQPQSNLFGSTNQTQPQSNSLFGSTQPQQQQQSSLFGNTSTNTLQPQQQGQLSSSLFASTSGSGNALASSISGSQRPEVDIGERMMAVQRAWDTSNPECRFKYFFYNVVEPGQAQQYGRPAGANDEAKWIKALRENPDPSCMVPVLATGWADVKKRSQMQEQIASVHQHKIKEISQALTTLSRQSNLTTSIRLTALQTQLAQLQHRLIRLAAQSPAFIPSLQSSALRPEEVETKKTLESVKSDLDGKKGSTANKGGYGMLTEYGTPKKGTGVRMMGQVNELWGQVEEIRRYKGRRGGGGERDGWLADEKVLGEIAEVLSTQQMALQKLNDLANDAVFDADVMRQGLGLISSHERHQT